MIFMIFSIFVKNMIKKDQVPCVYYKEEKNSTDWPFFSFTANKQFFSGLMYLAYDK